jgi:hypothetical protein
MKDNALLVKFTIDSTAELGPELATRLMNQFEQLELSERYVAEINLPLSPFAGHLEDLGPSPDSAQRVCDYLMRTAGTEERSHGANHWRPVVLKAVARCEEFCAGGFRLALGAVREFITA